MAITALMAAEPLGEGLLGHHQEGLSQGASQLLGDGHRPAQGIEDAIQSMPPFAHWLRGRMEILKWWVAPGAACRGSRLIPTVANRVPAFGHTGRAGLEGPLSRGPCTCLGSERGGSPSSPSS